jgi:peptide-methionine (S)-S-oxide reductase
VNDAQQLDELFRAAVAAIDAGDVDSLERLLAQHPRLVRERLRQPGAWLRAQIGQALDGFFKHPYLLWFVSEDAVRNGTLPANITEVTRAIIRAAVREHVDSLQEQLDYTLQLVSWSGVAAECGVQLELIDVLVDAGASPEVTDSALVNGHIEAAQRLLERGARLTLATALCLGRWDEVPRLARAAGARDRQMSFVLAALNGNARAVAAMLEHVVDVSAPSRDLYAHATPLHHAVCSGSLDTVKVLVEAGARLDRKDSIHGATPLGWAEHYVGELENGGPARQFREIAAYLGAGAPGAGARRAAGALRGRGGTSCAGRGYAAT